MKGDYSRDSFDPAKQFTRVLMQQGRVQLDADWNEQTSILLHYLQSLARDLIGPAGGPTDDLGFEIGVENQPSPPEITDLTIGPRRYYVDGLLCENVPPIADAAAPGEPGTIELARKGARANSLAVESQPEVSYYHQPNYPRDPEHDPLEAPLLAYLDVWERHICFLEDPDIREVALGGPDTAARGKLVWQVRTAHLSFTDQKPEDVTCTGFEQTKIWGNLVEELQPANRGHLKALAKAPEDSDEPCLVAPEARYRREENQLYRVEIHRPGVAGGQDKGATFKWSRENGSVVFPIQSIEGASVTLENLGRDDRLGLEVGDWVEVVDDDHSLLGKADPLLSVVDIDAVAMRVTLSAAAQGTVGQDLDKHPLLRRWDHQQGDPKTGGLELAKGAALVVESNSAWLKLEDGVQIQFQDGARYRTGDYWLIPARTETGDVEWPGPVGQPQAVPPHGVQHHYAPLALVFSRPAGVLVPGRGIAVTPAFAVTDLRHRFAPAGQCCPTVTIDSTRDGAQAAIGFTARVNPPDPSLTFKWQVLEGGDPAGASPSPAAGSFLVNLSAGSKSVTVQVTITGLPPYCQNVYPGTYTIPNS